MPVNHTQKGTPYGVRVHVLMRSVGGRKENRMQRASFELLGGALFQLEKAVEPGEERAPPQPMYSAFCFQQQ